jgi:hypothetical protein
LNKVIKIWILLKRPESTRKERFEREYYRIVDETTPVPSHAKPCPE